MNLDDELRGATADLRGQVDRIDVADLSPPRRTNPTIGLVLVLLVALGGFAFLGRIRGDEPTSLAVAPAPETPEAQVATPTGPEPAETTGPEATATISPTLPPSPVPTTPLFGQLTEAEPGDYWVPLAGGSAWNADESLVLLYRTGSNGPATHSVVDSATGAVIADLNLDAPDIEQVYWNPLDDDELLFAEGADLTGLNVRNSERRTVTSFENCDRVDSGDAPARPATAGIIGLLCHRGEARELIAYNLSSGVTQRRPTESAGAALPSPTGDRFVELLPDGSGLVLTSELESTGLVLDLRWNIFDFVVDADGTESVVATLFDGDWIGSVVVLPLVAAETPRVVIGPDRGDEYPPSGTHLSSAGSRVVISTSGPAVSPLSGRVVLVDLAADPAAVVVEVVEHQSAGQNGYWSSAFVSLSPTGRYALYSSDGGSGSVNTFVIPFGD